MEKLHVGLCRNSQRSWHKSTRAFASCSLTKDDSYNPLICIFRALDTYHSSQGEKRHYTDYESSRQNITIAVMAPRSYIRMAVI